MTFGFWVPLASPASIQPAWSFENFTTESLADSISRSLRPPHPRLPLRRHAILRVARTPQIDGVSFSHLVTDRCVTRGRFYSLLDGLRAIHAAKAPSREPHSAVGGPTLEERCIGLLEKDKGKCECCCNIFAYIRTTYILSNDPSPPTHPRVWTGGSP